MGGRGSNNRLSSSVSFFGSRISFLMLCDYGSIICGRTDAESRLYLINELDRRTGLGQSSASVDDTLKIIACREKQKILDALNAELEKARQKGFVPKHLSENSGNNAKQRLLAMVGIVTTFGHKNNRDAIRKAWMPTGAVLKIMEEKKALS